MVPHVLPGTNIVTDVTTHLRNLLLDSRRFLLPLSLDLVVLELSPRSPPISVSTITTTFTGRDYQQYVLTRLVITHSFICLLCLDLTSPVLVSPTTITTTITETSGRGGFGRGRGDRGRGRGRGRGRPRDDDKEWVPITKLGRLVKENKIKSLEDIYLFSMAIKGTPFAVVGLLSRLLVRLLCSV